MSEDTAQPAPDRAASDRAPSDRASSDRAADPGTVPGGAELQRSSRDRERIRAGLEQALARQLPDAADHRVGELAGTAATGMSSETLLFEASWEEAGGPRHESLVARVAPDPGDVPVFPSYDLPGQYRTIAAVADLTDVPVPPPWWCEADPAVLGAPFFVMGRVDGEVPPDVMPYNFGDSWLFSAPPERQRQLQDTTVGVLARLHAIAEPERHFPHLAAPGPGATALRRHVAGRQAWYRFATVDAGRSELLEKGFAWLEDHWPADEGPTVFCWGDARIGNVIYRDFQPAAVLDWEMAALGPAETDLAWLIYLHRMFEDMAAQFGFAGMPHFLRADDVATTYERLSGHTPRHLDWYEVYSAVQLGIVYLRTGYRSVHFGERPAPASADELLLNGPTLAALIA